MNLRSGAAPVQARCQGCADTCIIFCRCRRTGRSDPEIMQASARHILLPCSHPAEVATPASCPSAARACAGRGWGVDAAFPRRSIACICGSFLAQRRLRPRIGRLERGRCRRSLASSVALLQRQEKASPRAFDWMLTVYLVRMARGMRLGQMSSDCERFKTTPPLLAAAGATGVKPAKR